MNLQRGTLRGLKQIAHYLNVSESTAKRMIAKGMLPDARKSGCAGRTSRLEMPASGRSGSKQEE